MKPTPLPTLTAKPTRPLWAPFMVRRIVTLPRLALPYVPAAQTDIRRAFAAERARHG